MQKAGASLELAEMLRRGMALQQAGRFGEAEAVYRQVLRAQPGQPQALHFLGLIAKALGRLADAESLIRQAIAAKPDYAEAWHNLGNTLRQMSRLEPAVEAVETAVSLKPASLESRRGLGETLIQAERFGEGIACLRRAVELHPATALAHFALANGLQEAGDFAAAVESYRAAESIDPNLAGIHNNLAAALIKLGDMEAALAAADAQLARDPQNPPAVAYKAQALEELGRGAEAAELVDFDRFVFRKHLEPPPGFASLADFNAALERDLRTHPTLVETVDPKQRAIRGGAAAVALHAAPTPAIAAMEAAFRQAIDTWAASLPDDPNHPFLCGKPQAYRLNMWGNLLASQGHQAAHIHNAGWASGVYYVDIPESVHGGDSGQAGWIEFGRPGYGLPSRKPPRLRAIAPETGTMLLFPSYFWHRTIPFEDKAERISIAFDLSAAA
jgi:tetratricopeptide (TPR) repeat protein